MRFVGYTGAFQFGTGRKFYGEEKVGRDGREVGELLTKWNYDANIIDLIRKAKLSGYYVVLFFVYLQSEDIAVERVASRVKKGGHNIPVDVIRRRYKKGIGNFVKYSDEADDCYLYDNTGEYELIAKFVDDQETIFNVESFEKLSVMNTKNKPGDLSAQIQVALDKAIKKAYRRRKSS